MPIRQHCLPTFSVFTTKHLTFFQIESNMTKTAGKMCKILPHTHSKTCGISKIPPCKHKNITKKFHRNFSRPSIGSKKSFLSYSTPPPPQKIKIKIGIFTSFVLLYFLILFRLSIRTFMQNLEYVAQKMSELCSI